MRLTSAFVAAALFAAPALAEDVAYTVDGENFTGYWAEAENPAGLVLIIQLTGGVRYNPANQIPNSIIMEFDIELKIKKFHAGVLYALNEQTALIDFIFFVFK